jgi:eukaryotic-like serine/threonine-protein kinase
VLGRYRPVQPLGSGGSGSVWLARDEAEGGHVTLKIVAREGKAAARAEREAAAAARLNHERCLQARDFGADADHAYIAYEYVPGETFRHALRAGRLDDEATVEAGAQILEGLAHAHDLGIVHRDVKPSNVLLAEGDGVSVRLLDFGLALFDEADTLTAAGDVPGTLAYIAPERLKGQTTGPAADVWAVGVLLWEALAGWHPYWTSSLLDTAKKIQEAPPTLAEARPDLPATLIEIVDRAMSRDPRRRPSALRMAAAVRSAWRSRERRRRESRSRGPRSVATGRIAGVALAATVAGWSASSLPFYPDGSPWILAGLAAALTLARERAGLVFTLAVPVLPLGNVSQGLALAYVGAALAWLALSWGDPRRGLVFAAGPLLAPFAAIGLLPLVLMTVSNPLRRAASAVAGVVSAVAVAAITAGTLPLTTEAAPTRLPVGRTGSATEAASAAWDLLARSPAVLLAAGVLALASLILPVAVRRGYWAIAAYGAVVIAALLLPDQRVAALPVVATGWITCLALAAATYLREESMSPRQLVDVLRARLSGGLIPAATRAPAE